ncbi:N-6 DNA methylase [Microbacterium trichothecenolyticum]
MYAAAIAEGQPVSDLLDGSVETEATPYEVLRALTPVALLKERGTFFTSSSMASQLWDGYLNTVSDNSTVVDPACGAGDLLLPVLAAEDQASARNVRIVANDLDSRFALIAGSRLAAMASTSQVSIESSTCNFLSNPSTVAGATHVVLNPPFIGVDLEEPWARGKTNVAALFVVRALESMVEGSLLLALLPDVLRSGSRYENWRERIADLGTILEVRPLGQFDLHTDVDVFKLAIQVGGTGTNMNWHPRDRAQESLSDYCDVRVGPVVPHRDDEAGPLVKFMTARSISAGASLTRRFSGRLENGPLILINRTSRPGEVPRVRAHVHRSDDPLAVENHLLVVKPKPGKSTSIEDVLAVLKRTETAEFLDTRIRCRHLTVRAIKEIPWRANA